MKLEPEMLEAIGTVWEVAELMLNDPPTLRWEMGVGRDGVTGVPQVSLFVYNGSWRGVFRLTMAAVWNGDAQHMTIRGLRELKRRAIGGEVSA